MPKEETIVDNVITLSVLHIQITDILNNFRKQMLKIQHLSLKRTETSIEAIRIMIAWYEQKLFDIHEGAKHNLKVLLKEDMYQFIDRSVFTLKEMRQGYIPLIQYGKHESKFIRTKDDPGNDPEFVLFLHDYITKTEQNILAGEIWKITDCHMYLKELHSAIPKHLENTLIEFYEKKPIK